LEEVALDKWLEKSVPQSAGQRKQKRLPVNLVGDLQFRGGGKKTQFLSAREEEDSGLLHKQSVKGGKKGQGRRFLSRNSVTLREKEEKILPYLGSRGKKTRKTSSRKRRKGSAYSYGELPSLAIDKGKKPI